MNWGRIIIAGVAAGVVVSLADFVMHGQILANTYINNPEVFSQEANQMWFPLITICITIMAALLYAKTVDSWAPGVSGGIAFGFFLSLVAFFFNFFHPLVIAGFPYYLAWCWGGINIIEGLIGGAVIGALYKKA